MTTNDIDAVRAKVPAVYEGPWYVQFREEDGRWLVGYPTDNPKAGLIATVPDYGEQLAEFIAAARTLVPALCDEIEQLRADLKTVEGQRDSHYRDFHEAYQNWQRVDAELEKVRGRLTDTRHRADEPEYLIWSAHHKTWWAPNRRGYRSNVNDAGRYTLAEAQAEMRRGCYCCQVPEVPVRADVITGAGERTVRGAIAEATKAAIEAGQVNRCYEAEKAGVA